MKQVWGMGRAPAVLAFALFALVALAGTAVAALQGNENRKGDQVIIGADNDVKSDPTIQPVPSPPGPDQSLSKSDQIFGGKGDDTLIGRLGPDVITANAGDDVIVGGTEGGQPAPPLPNSDIAFGGFGSDTFVWSPGDGSDAFVGGKPERAKDACNQKSKKKLRRCKRQLRNEADTLVIGNQLLTADSSLPLLFDTRFGELPRVFSSDRGVPTPLGGTPPRNPNLTGFCQIVDAPPGLEYEFLVRFFAGTPPALAVTIRTKGVEQVICPTQNSDAMTLTTLGKRGSGPLRVRSTDFTPERKSKLAAFVF